MDGSDRLGRRVNLRDLRTLMAVADTGSMAKAAASLRISHPAVSKTISELEGVLGARLLDRSPQGAELTPSGEVLLRCGINIFDELRQGYQSLENLADPVVESVGLPMLLLDLLQREAAGIVRRLRVIRDAEVFEASLQRGLRHRLERLGPVGGVRVAMQDPAQVLMGYELRQLSFQRALDLTASLPQFGLSQRYRRAMLPPCATSAQTP
jgi:molybdenum-dependent DNA-binding transcriptional regulator ModE